MPISQSKSIPYVPDFEVDYIDPKTKAIIG